MKIEYFNSKTILNKSSLQNIDYTINPYIGCGFGCKYCYASYLSNLVKENSTQWGNFVYVKQNCIQLLEKELGKMILNYKKPSIMLSSSTDPYQYIEAKEKLTQKILQTFINFKFDGKLLCLTKSPIILRDINLLKQIKHLKVGLSICHNNEKLKSFFEPNAPSIKSRFETLKILNKNGIDTCVFIAPILPYYDNHLDELEVLFNEIKKSGTNSVVCDLLNLYGNMNVYKNLFKNNVKAKKLYVDKLYDDNYQSKMQTFICKLIEKYKFNNNIL